MFWILIAAGLTLIGLLVWLGAAMSRHEDRRRWGNDGGPWIPGAYDNDFDDWR